MRRKVSKGRIAVFRVLAEIAKDITVDTKLRLIAANKLLSHGVRVADVDKLVASPASDRTYVSYGCMKQRCLNPKATGFKYYGGAGIQIDPRWLGEGGFTNFLSDMGERPEGCTLDRYPDNAGGYGPTNCRWATPKMQADNRRPRKHHVRPSTTKEKHAQHTIESSSATV
jgi:hypothetical protein